MTAVKVPRGVAAKLNSFADVLGEPARGWTSAPGGAVNNLGRFAERVSAHLSQGGPAVARLAHANTSIGFHAEGETVVLALDRSPVAIEEDAGPVEIDIWLDPHAAAALSDGSRSLTVEILAGRVRYRGPVRKYLVVEPILRGLLRTGP